MSKAKASILAGMLAATIFVSGCANQGGFAGGKVAMVNGTAITKAEFDKAYMQDMVTDHQKDVSEFRRISERGTDPDVKAFAAKILPTQEDHLKAAQAGLAQVKQ